MGGWFGCQNIGYVGRALVRSPRASAFSLPTNFIPTPPGWERNGTSKLLWDPAPNYWREESDAPPTALLRSSPYHFNREQIWKGLWHLADAEVALLDEVWAEHGGKDQWQLVDWCHTHCKEWTPVANGCAPIAVEQVGMALGKSAAQVNRLRQEATELNQLDEIFAVA